MRCEEEKFSLYFLACGQPGVKTLARQYKHARKSWFKPSCIHKQHAISGPGLELNFTLVQRASSMQLNISDVDRSRPINNNQRFAYCSHLEIKAASHCKPFENYAENLEILHGVTRPSWTAAPNLRLVPLG